MARPADPNARSALIAAARKEFVHAGIRGARIEDITQSCGLSKGAFYLHFESKEALFAELVAAFRERTDALLLRRKESMAAFFMEQGPLTARDVQKRTSRYERLLTLETALDRETLSTRWGYRDV